MLVISRKKDEHVKIGDEIVVTILAIEGDRVKIGIEAPREMTILRQEILEAVREQTRLQKLMAGEDKPERLEPLRQLLASETEPEVPVSTDNPA